MTKPKRTGEGETEAFLKDVNYSNMWRLLYHIAILLFDIRRILKSEVTRRASRKKGRK